MSDGRDGSREEIGIGDHAFLSDCRTAALISPDGGVDWMCVPRFDAELRTGETAVLALGHDGAGAPSTVEEAHRWLETSRSSWEGWAGRADHEGIGAEHVHRGAPVLRGLLHADSGGLVAAPTTSLPEWPGGPRNWDHRYPPVSDRGGHEPRRGREPGRLARVGPQPSAGHRGRGRPETTTVTVTRTRRGRRYARRRHLSPGRRETGR